MSSACHDIGYNASHSVIYDLSQSDVMSVRRDVSQSVSYLVSNDVSHDISHLVMMSQSSCLSVKSVMMLVSEYVSPRKIAIACPGKRRN